MKTIKKIIKLIAMFMIIANTISQANNSNTFKAKIIPTSKEIKAGNKITITLSIYDIKMGDYGINTLEGIIEYDKEIFETVKSTDIQSKNNWSTTYNDENSILNGKFLSANLTSGVKEDTEIFTVTLKVHSYITESINTKITFKDITSNNGTNLINAGTETIEVKINGGSIESSSSETNLINANNEQKNNIESTKSKNIIIIIGIAAIIVIIIFILKKKK